MFTSVSFISLIQSVNDAQFLRIIFLIPLSGTVSAASVVGTVIVPLTSMYASL